MGNAWENPRVSKFARVMAIMTASCLVFSVLAVVITVTIPVVRFSTEFHFRREHAQAHYDVNPVHVEDGLCYGLAVGFVLGVIISWLNCRPTNERDYHLKGVQRALEENARQAHADGRFDDEQRYRREIDDIKRDRGIRVR